MKEVKHREKEVLFSYVDVDPFEDREEYTESVTTSQDEKPTALAMRTQKTELSRGKFSKAGLGKEICKPFQVMYICAGICLLVQKYSLSWYKSANTDASWTSRSQGPPGPLL
jgi:hypothetical protein